MLAAHCSVLPAWTVAHMDLSCAVGQYFEVLRYRVRFDVQLYFHASKVPTHVSISCRGIHLEVQLSTWITPSAKHKRLQRYHACTDFFFNMCCCEINTSWSSPVGTMCKRGDVLVELQVGRTRCPWPGGATQYCSTHIRSQRWVRCARQWASHTYSEQTCQLASLVFCDSAVNVLIAALHVETCDERLLFYSPALGCSVSHCSSCLRFFSQGGYLWEGGRGFSELRGTWRSWCRSCFGLLPHACSLEEGGVFIFFPLILKKISFVEMSWNAVWMNRCRDMCLILQSSRGSRLGSYKRNHTLQDRGAAVHDLLGSPAWQKASCRGGRRALPAQPGTSWPLCWG